MPKESPLPLPEFDVNNLPQHVAIIMDGNGRWAKQRGNLRIFGHKEAIKAVRDTTEFAAEIGIPYLTLYAFSTENWGRPPAEVDALMTLLVSTLKKEKETLVKNSIRLNAIGNLEDLPALCRKQLATTIEATKHGERMTLTLALSYGSRQDIVQAFKTLAQDIKSGKINIEDITQESISNKLCTHNLPDPSLVIRTSGEFRVSNFLLWEIAYAELYVSSVMWPDFRRTDFAHAIIDYQKRERRFGKTSEQIANEQ